MNVRFPPELYQQCDACHRVDHGICGFPSRISLEAFTRRFRTKLSKVPPWLESILCVKVEAAQGKQVLWNGLRQWGTLGLVHDPGVPFAFPVENASS